MAPSSLLLLLPFSACAAYQLSGAAPRYRTAARSSVARMQIPAEREDAAQAATAPTIMLSDEALEAHKAAMIKKAPSLAVNWRRADFWINETATFLDVVNVLGRFDSCDEWVKRTEFVEVDNPRIEDEAQAETLIRHEMALRLKCAERVALWQNAPKLPFKNAALAKSFGLTVEEFNAMPVRKEACNVLFDALAESRSGLIPYDTMNKRISSMINSDGSFNEASFRIGHTKSTVLIIVGWFIFGKANFIWVLVGARFLHDARPDIVPSPVDLGLFKIFGVI